MHRSCKQDGFDMSNCCYNSHVDLYEPDEQESSSDTELTIFFSSTGCKFSKELQKFIDENKDYLTDDSISIYDIITLNKGGVDIPEYVDYVPVLIVSDSNTKEIVNDGIIYGHEAITEYLNKKLGIKAKRSGNWARKIPRPKSASEAQALSTSVFNIPCERKGKKEALSEVEKKLKEYEKSSSAFGIHVTKDSNTNSGPSTGANSQGHTDQKKDKKIMGVSSGGDNFRSVKGQQKPTSGAKKIVGYAR